MEDARLIVHVPACKVKAEGGAREAREFLAAHVVVVIQGINWVRGCIRDLFMMLLEYTLHGLLKYRRTLRAPRPEIQESR